MHAKIHSIHFLTVFVPCTQSLKFVYAWNFGTFLSPLDTVPPVTGFRYSRAFSLLQVNFPKPEIETVLFLETACLISGKIIEYVAHDTCEQTRQEKVLDVSTQELSPPQLYRAMCLEYDCFLPFSNHVQRRLFEPDLLLSGRAPYL